MIRFLLFILMCSFVGAADAYYPYRYYQPKPWNYYSRPYFPPREGLRNPKKPYKFVQPYSNKPHWYNHRDADPNVCPRGYPWGSIPNQDYNKQDWRRHWK